VGFGRLHGGHELCHSYDDDGSPDGAHLNATLHGQALRCGVGKLHLQGRDELDAAHTVVDIPVEDVDPSDFYDLLYERDDDW
jgi:hypothetical protein